MSDKIYPTDFLYEIAGKLFTEYHGGEKQPPDWENEYEVSQRERQIWYSVARKAIDELQRSHDDTIVGKASSKSLGPITEQWLESVGFNAVASDMGPNYSAHYELGVMNIWEFNGTGTWLLSDADRLGMKTQRDAREVARMLGLTFAEATKP